MEEGSTKVNNIVVRVMVLRRYVLLFSLFGSFCFNVTFIPTFFIHVMLYFSTSNCFNLLGKLSRMNNVVILAKKSGRHIRRKDGL